MLQLPVRFRDSRVELSEMPKPNTQMRDFVRLIRHRHKAFLDGNADCCICNLKKLVTLLTQMFSQIQSRIQLDLTFKEVKRVAAKWWFYLGINFLHSMVNSFAELCSNITMLSVFPDNFIFTFGNLGIFIPAFRQESTAKNTSSHFFISSVVLLSKQTNSLRRFSVLFLYKIAR